MLMTCKYFFTPAHSLTARINYAKQNHSPVAGRENVYDNPLPGIFFVCSGESYKLVS